MVFQAVTQLVDTISSPGEELQEILELDVLFQGMADVCFRVDGVGRATSNARLDQVATFLKVTQDTMHSLLNQTD